MFFHYFNLQFNYNWLSINLYGIFKNSLNQYTTYINVIGRVIMIVNIFTELIQCFKFACIFNCTFV